MIKPPPNQTPVQEQIKNRWTVTRFWQEFYSAVFNVVFAVQQSGTTDQRPTAGLWIGRRFYDTTLNLPIYLKSTSPSVWTDAAGNVV